MGVLNVTPDSFSDGGRFTDPAAAVAHGLALVQAGAVIVDVGGESTRPGHAPVAAKEQIRRVLPVIEALHAQGVRTSIDTTRAEVAAAAVAAGAELVNDVSALQEDPALAEVVADTGCSVVLMHRFAPPRTRADRADPLAAILATLAARVDHAVAMGIAHSRIIVDPGIGFGTRADDVPVILSRIGALRQLGCPVLVGPSRKSFLQALTGRPVGEREFATAAVVAAMTLAGVELLRVHAVAAMLDVVRVASALKTAGQ